MRNLIIAFLLFIPISCSSKITNIKDKGLEIDIYKNDMTYEKFKQYVIDYAEKARYPSLTSK